VAKVLSKHFLQNRAHRVTMRAPQRINLRGLVL
jgi:hypothetical protein